MTHNELDHFPDASKMVDLAARIERAEGQWREDPKPRDQRQYVKQCLDEFARNVEAAALRARSAS